MTTSIDELSNRGLDRPGRLTLDEAAPDDGLRALRGILAGIGSGGVLWFALSWLLRSL